MNIKQRILLVGIALLIFCAFTSIASATTWYVDDGGGPGIDFTNIQDAINSATAGDTIIVREGTYYENIFLKDGVRVQGEGADVTTIKGKGADSVVTAVNVGSGTLLSGFTITNGTATYGGGIYIKSSSVVIENNTIIANMASAAGAGIVMYQNSLPTITGNIITQNGGQLILLFGEWVLGPVAGGGIEVHGSSPTITNNIISENSARYGGGINFSAFSGGQAINNVLMDNTAIHRGGGIDVYHYSSPTITNNIIVDNSGRGIDVYFESTPLIDFNDIWNNRGGNYGWDASAGPNDISADPLFVNPAIGDYHLQAGSPCIDTGTNVEAPSTDLAGNPRPIDGDGNGVATVDMGAFEYVPSAKVFCQHNIISDNEFTNANAMTQQEIQGFLESKGSCLATYKVDGKSAAQIIYEECQAKKISPKVMLATIQKETSLLGLRKDKCNDIWSGSDTWADRAFMCDRYNPNTKGFDKQATCAAKTFRKWYAEDKVCEEMQVTDGAVIPLNRATYALYKYTPEISGNRLFYNIYTGWSWDPKGGSYTPGTSEKGCCEYCKGKCYDGNRDPEECRACYGGTWYPGWHCEEGECIPEFATIAIPVVTALLLVFLISRRKQKR